MLTNPRNSASWPKVVSKDVQMNVESLHSKLTMIAGHVAGKTMLPLPIGAEKKDYCQQLERLVLPE
jgi:dynein heavy chain